MEFIRALFADELAEAETLGEARAVARGEARASRRLGLELLRARFGALPDSVVARLEQMDTAACRALALRLLTAGSLAELGLLENGPGGA
jgi:hypothetical protein